MIRKLTLLCFVGVSACSVAPPVFFPMPQAMPAPISQAVPQSAKQRFINAAAANGCIVNEANSALIIASATLSVEDLGRVMTELRAEGGGQIAADGRSFRVTSGACA
jgi:hypothetical protein